MDTTYVYLSETIDDGPVLSSGAKNSEISALTFPKPAPHQTGTEI